MQLLKLFSYFVAVSLLSLLLLLPHIGRCSLAGVWPMREHTLDASVLFLSTETTGEQIKYPHEVKKVKHDRFSK